MCSNYSIDENKTNNYSYQNLTYTAMCYSDTDNIYIYIYIYIYILYIHVYDPENPELQKGIAKHEPLVVGFGRNGLAPKPLKGLVSLATGSRE